MGIWSLLQMLPRPKDFTQKNLDVPRLIPEARETGYAKSFDGTRIYWERHGPALHETDKRPMIFCYGLVCAMNQWRVQLERYSVEHPCFLLDYRGHHKSDQPLDRDLMNISAIARDISAVVHHVGIKQKIHIWGHSMGCNAALEFALLEPNLCQSLVLCCGTAENPFQNMFGMDWPEKILNPLLAAVQSHPQLAYPVWDTLCRNPTWTQMVAGLAGFNTDTSTREDIEAYARAVCSIRAETFFALLAEMNRGLTKAILPRIKTPVICVAGALDRVTPPSEQKNIADLLPDAEYVEIPAGSHNVQLDFGEYVALKVESIWRQRNLM